LALPLLPVKPEGGISDIQKQANEGTGKIGMRRRNEIYEVSLTSV